MLRPKSLTGSCNPELLRPLLVLRAQGWLPWAFFASCAFHVLLAIAVSGLSQQVLRHALTAKNREAVHVTLRQIPSSEPYVSLSTRSPELSQQLLSSAHHNPTAAASAASSTEFEQAVASADSPQQEAIQPISIPSGITSIWGTSHTHRPETIQQTMAKAQWQARTQEAFRQLSMLHQTFANAPRPDQAMRCSISATMQTCTPSHAHFAQFWAIQLGPLFRIDPGFPIIEMNYALQDGWYAVVQKPSAPALSSAP